MADVTISREAVEAAARALAESDTPPKKWTDLQPSTQYRWAVRAKAALEAALPAAMAAYLEGPFANALKDRADQRAQVDGDDHDENGCEDEGYDCHTAAAVATWLRARTMAKACAIELRAQT